jgi:abequosyltransferase
VSDAPAPLLSVCIPTYNFGAFIGETLDSILGQLQPGVEVVVVDGASTDDTREVVQARQHPDVPLRFVELEAKGGIDVDIARSVEAATGTFCWLFSADDHMRPGALRRALEVVRERPDLDVIVVQHTNCDRNMLPFGLHPVFKDGAAREADLHDAGERAAWFEAADTTEALFSFMSGQVIKRSTWRNAPDASRFMGTCWGIAGRLLQQATVGPLRVQFLPEAWLDKRGENDSFMNRGLVKRLAIAIEGYLSIMRDLFGDGSLEVRETRRVLNREMSIPVWLDANARTKADPTTEDPAHLRELFDALHDPRDPRDLVKRLVVERAPEQRPTTLIRAAVAFRWLAGRGP